MEETWEALDELIGEIEAANGVWTEAREQRARERATVSTMLEQIESHLREFDPDGALDQIRERLLGGAGNVERVATMYNLDRLFMLRWPAAADPRPELSAAAGDYHIEIWLGIGEGFRPRVRVVGAKRMEALLPVTAEKFRSVLISAVRNPVFTPHEEGEGDTGRETAGTEGEAAATNEQQTSATTPAEAPATAGPGSVNGGRTSAPVHDEPSEAAAQAQAAGAARAPEPGGASTGVGEEPAHAGDGQRHDAASRQEPPADDEPIPMGPPTPDRASSG